MELLSTGSKEVTIYDIARELNISPATVSRGLNDHPAVNKETKKKIENMAKEMGYRSNTFASNLRRQRTHTIGVIVPRLNSYFMSAVISGMEKVANSSGFNLIIGQSLETATKEAASAQTMFNSRVDGLLVSLAYDTDNIDHFKDFLKKGIPLIFFDRVFNHSQCTGIIIDNFKAAQEATNHLIEQGCRRIVHVTGNQKRNVYADRLGGYKYALSNLGLEFNSNLIIETDLSVEAGVAAADQIRRMNPLPDGVFAANDACAVSCLLALKQAGISVPHDIAFVGFNNDPLSKVVEPNLTTVNYPGHEMGEVAAQTLINHLNGTVNINNTNTIILRSELVIRGSSIRNGGAK
ncbi:MAG: LacI family transcriptional regulator [Adhaeribacter sp.]|nr:LacI family transcriptional regulator [Adhaeribacter sp.]